MNHLPESYKTSATRINEANDEIARLKEENEKLRAQAKAPAEEPVKEEAAEEEPKATTKKTTSSKKKE